MDDPVRRRRRHRRLGAVFRAAALRGPARQAHGGRAQRPRRRLDHGREPVLHAGRDADGLSILGTSASTQYPAMLGDPRVRYDYADWTPILASPTGGVVYVQAEFGVDGPEDLETLRGIEMRFGSQGATQLEMPALLAFKMLGLSVRPVFGMESRGQGRLAFERGEAGIDFQTASAYLGSVVPLVDAGKAVPLFTPRLHRRRRRAATRPHLPRSAAFRGVLRSRHRRAARGRSFRGLAGDDARRVLAAEDDRPAEGYPRGRGRRLSRRGAGHRGRAGLSPARRRRDRRLRADHRRRRPRARCRKRSISILPCASS